jgi:hypothetical protein
MLTFKQFTEAVDGSVKRNRELLATGRISKDEFDRRMGYGKYKKSKDPSNNRLDGPGGLYKNLVKRMGEEVDLDEELEFRNRVAKNSKSTEIFHQGKHVGTISKHYPRNGRPDGYHTIQYHSSSAPKGAKGILHHERIDSHDDAKKMVVKHFNESVELGEAESWEAGYKRRVVKTAKPEHKEKGYNWRIKGKERPEISIKLYKEKPSQQEFNKQMKRVAGHEFGG